jgi:hypothetical protein
LCGTLVASGLPAPVASGSIAKFEPPDGEAYFGFTYKLRGDDMPVSEREAWGDTRLFAERICNSVEVELDGKAPRFIKVQNGWKSRGGAPQPFYVSLDKINMIHAILGPSVVPMLEWQAGEPGFPDIAVALTADIASGQYDNYIRQYAQDVKAYGGPLFIRLICGEFNGGW